MKSRMKPANSMEKRSMNLLFMIVPPEQGKGI